jgi:uncharacterized integral membrane protein (TIGR00697 family)
MTLLKDLSENAIRNILIALSVYITALIASNTLGMKIMPFLFDSHLSVGVFMFPIVFLMTDVIGELYGKRMAKFFVTAGIVSTVLWILFSFLSLSLPWADAEHWAHGSYETIFGLSIRIAIASVVAFAIAEYQDVLSFFFFKAKFGEKLFWLRSTFSNIWSQFLDTVIFMVVAFYGVYENDTLITLIITWWLFKVAMGFLYTPLSYVGLWLLKDRHAKK